MRCEDFRDEPRVDQGLLSTLDPSQQQPRPEFTVVAFGAFLALYGAYFLFIHQYAVNTIYNDQWWDVQLLQHWYSGTLNLSDLWAQHGENRILFANLVMLAVAELAHLNTVAEAYLSGLLFSASTFLIIWAHKRRSPAINWLWYVPAAALLLSFVQYQDTLWGFQLAWYLVYFALATSLFLLDRPRLTWWVLGTAVILAVIGSYSSLQGLLIWPVGLLLLYQRDRSRRMLLTWLACAVVAVGVYFYKFSPSSGGASSYVFAHPVTGAKFFLISIGDVLGVGVPPTPNAGTDVVIGFGLVIFLLACWVLFTFGRHRDDTSGTPFGVALTAYGVLFAALVTSGRAHEGLFFAAGSRYTTFSLLIPAGCYLTLLSGWVRTTRQTASDVRPPRQRISVRVATVVLVVVIGAQVMVGTVTGLDDAGYWKQQQQYIGRLTVNGTKATEGYQEGILLPSGTVGVRRGDEGCVFCYVFRADLPRLIQVAREHRLSLFGTGDAAVYAKEGIPLDAVPTTRIVGPSPGARVRGTVFVEAAATGMSEVTRVNFVLTGGGLHDVRIASGAPAGFVWLAGWHTSTVPNGVYRLQSVAYDATGRVGRSPSVSVRVDN